MFTVENGKVRAIQHHAHGLLNDYIVSPDAGLETSPMENRQLSPTGYM